MRIPFELRERWPNTKKVMDQITELATLNSLHITSFRVVPSWPRQYVIIAMNSETAAKRMANIILQEGNGLAFVAEYVTAAEKARKAAREAGARAGASSAAGFSGATQRQTSTPLALVPGGENWNRGVPDAWRAVEVEGWEEYVIRRMEGEVAEAGPIPLKVGLVGQELKKGAHGRR